MLVALWVPECDQAAADGSCGVEPFDDQRMFCGIGSAKALQAPADGVESL